MQTPVHTIVFNAEVEGVVVDGKLLEQNNPDLGYDAAKGQCSPFSFFVVVFKYFFICVITINYVVNYFSCCFVIRRICRYG